MKFLLSFLISIYLGGVVTKELMQLGQLSMGFRFGDKDGKQ